MEFERVKGLRSTLSLREYNPQEIYSHFPTKPQHTTVPGNALFNSNVPALTLVAVSVWRS